jgi:hypothetical protein
MRTHLVGLALILAIVSAAAEARADWQAYRYPELGLSIEAPKPPVRTESTVATDGGPVQQINFVVDLSGGIAGAVVVLDLRRLLSGDFAIDSLVANAVTNTKATIASDKAVTLAGVTGRDVVLRRQGDNLVSEMRVFISQHVVYQIMVTGPLPALPPEADRYLRGVALLPWHWLLYALPPDAFLGQEPRKIPFSRWVRASPKVFASFDACRTEAVDRKKAEPNMTTDWMRFDMSVCFDPDSKHMRSIQPYAGGYTPPLDQPGLVADPFMR